MLKVLIVLQLLKLITFYGELNLVLGIGKALKVKIPVLSTVFDFEFKVILSGYGHKLLMIAEILLKKNIQKYIYVQCIVIY